MPFKEKLFNNIKIKYTRFLIAISKPQVALLYKKRLKQTNFNLCRLLVLKVVCHVFYKYIGNIAKAK